MSTCSRFVRTLLLFILFVASSISFPRWATSTASAQSEPQVLIQLTEGSDIQQLVADYQLLLLDAVPVLSIYHVQLSSADLVSKLANDKRVVTLEQSAMESLFEARRQVLSPGSPEVEMLQRYIGFGSGDDSNNINPVPDEYIGGKKIKSVEQVLIDGHRVKLDNNMRKWAYIEVKLDKALKQATGIGVIVAVLDTGVDLTHPQLVDHLLPGYDFVDQDAIPNDQPDGNDEDEDGQIDEGVGHGTHVAGIIATVAPDARILPVRVLNSDGAGTRFDIIQGTVFAVDHGAQVINFSLSTAEDSAMLASAIEYALNHGVTVVAAATGDDSSLEFPAAYPGVISVGSVRKDHRFSNFSQSFASMLDVAAPGELVYSTYVGGQHAWWSGSSMAAPFVSGGAALMREGGGCTANCVSQFITSEVEDIKDRNKYSAKCGGLNLEKAVKKALKEDPVAAIPDLASLSCADGKPEQLTFEYTGDVCSAQSNSQGNKFRCSGSAGEETVSIAVTKDANKFSVSPTLVEVGDLVTISSTEAKALKDLKLKIGGQSVELSTACDVTLSVGDAFGSIVLRGYLPEGLIARSGPLEEDSSNTTYLPLVSR